MKKPLPLIALLLLTINVWAQDEIPKPCPPTKPQSCSAADGSEQSELCQAFRKAIATLTLRQDLIFEKVRYMKSLRPDNPIIPEIERHIDVIREGMVKDLAPYKSLISF